MKPVLQWENSPPHVLHFLHQIQEEVQPEFCKNTLLPLKGERQLFESCRQMIKSKSSPFQSRFQLLRGALLPFSNRNGTVKRSVFTFLRAKADIKKAQATF
ncbi:hypothetical protein [Candidatus Electronema sp. PJ]|uniref:hypothetical protein n=1 Tax=Candidatus Electronema sp. PJ TaxID=3401572 RepID=UPI003AA96084